MNIVTGSTGDRIFIRRRQTCVDSRVDPGVKRRLMDRGDRAIFVGKVGAVPGRSNPVRATGQGAFLTWPRVALAISCTFIKFRVNI